MGVGASAGRQSFVSASSMSSRLSMGELAFWRQAYSGVRAECGPVLLVRRALVGVKKLLATATQQGSF